MSIYIYTQGDAFMKLKTNDPVSQRGGSGPLRPERMFRTTSNPKQLIVGLAASGIYSVGPYGRTTLRA